MNKNTVILPIANELQVSPKKVIHYMQIALGSKVSKGDVIAKKSGLLGMKRKKVISPVNGKVVSLREKAGELVIESEEIEEKKDVDESKDEKKGDYGFGKGKGDIIYFQEEISLEHLDKRVEGKVLVCDGIRCSGVVYKFNALGGKGLVIKKIKESLKKELEEKVKGKVDLGFLSLDEIKDLKNKKDKKVLINGKRRVLCVLS